MKTLLIISVMLFIPTFSFDQYHYPSSPIVPVTDTYSGKQVVYNFRWLENMNDPEVQSWFKSQHDYTNSLPGKIPGRGSLFNDFKKSDTLADAEISDITRKANRYFYKKTFPGGKVGKLYYRDGKNEKEILLYNGVADNNIDLVVSNPKIINTEDGSITLNHDILIKGNIIVNIIPHRIKYDKSVKIIDAHNMYAIPGLWNMHVHALWSGWFDICNPLMVAYGITGFRDMWGDLKLADTVRTKMANGEIPFQRFIVAGGLIDGAKPIWPTAQVADSPERGIELIDSLYKAGADFIKVYSRLTPETFQAIANHCKELNINFLGHVPTKVKVIDASNAGMYSMEHLYGVTESFSDREDSFFNIINKMDFAKADSDLYSPLSIERLQMLVRSKIAPEKVKRVCDVLKTNNTWIVPTLVVLRNMAYLDVLDTIGDERLDYLPHVITNRWKVKNDFRLKNRTAQQWKDAKTIYNNNLIQLSLLNKNSVPILAGTDLGNPYVFPGSSLLDELGLLNKAGLTPLQALQTATLNPAKYLNKTDSLGTISPYKYADILLLAGNPLEDISNIKKIEGLCVNGKFYNKKDLESLKQKAKSFSEEVNQKYK